MFFMPKNNGIVTREQYLEMVGIEDKKRYMEELKWWIFI